MNKYPLDAQAMQDIANDIIQHDSAHREIISDLMRYLETAIEEIGPDVEDTDWYKECGKMLASLKKRKNDFENHRFDQKNGYKTDQNSPYNDFKPMDIFTEGKLNDMESKWGEEMSESDLAVYFKEKTPKKKKEKKINKMTQEEIQEWEKKQDNSNDIYRLSARIKNLARKEAGANLTPAGDILCNSLTHLLKKFYDFAETIEDKETQIKLTDLIRANEDMASNVMAAFHSGVKV